jgi:hypothetical protein
MNVTWQRDCIIAAKEKQMFISPAIVAQKVNKFSIVYAIQRFIVVLTKAGHSSLSWAKWN